MLNHLESRVKGRGANTVWLSKLWFAEHFVHGSAHVRDFVPQDLQGLEAHDGVLTQQTHHGLSTNEIQLAVFGSRRCQAVRSSIQCRG